MESSSSSSTATKTIAMITNDAMLFHVHEPVAMEFGVVKSYFNDNPDAAAAASALPLPNVDCNHLAKIVAYCQGRLEFRSREKPADDAEIKAYDKEFLAKFTAPELKPLMQAANYLEVKEVLDLVAQALADHIANKSVEYVRRFFGIKNDYTAAEEEQLQKENKWAFDGVDPDSDDDYTAAEEEQLQKRRRTKE